MDQSTKLISCLTLIFLISCGPGKYILNEENDYFTLFNKDHDYTQGLELSHENHDRRILIGQKIFTPVHKKVSPAPAHERPYAGYLYSSYRVFDDEKEPDKKPFTEIEFGLIGPNAFGEEVQCGFHKMVGQTCPAGWPEQLHTEPGVTLRAGNTIKKASDFILFSGITDYSFEAEIGNISTAAHIGTKVDFQITRWLHFFAGPTLHLVARDIFLDGNTFQDSPSVESKWSYSEIAGGFEFKVNGWPTFLWFMKAQSKQYEEQEGTYNYGGVKISWDRN